MIRDYDSVFTHTQTASIVSSGNSKMNAHISFRVCLEHFAWWLAELEASTCVMNPFRVRCACQHNMHSLFSWVTWSLFCFLAVSPPHAVIFISPDSSLAVLYLVWRFFNLFGQTTSSLFRPTFNYRFILENIWTFYYFRRNIPHMDLNLVGRVNLYFLTHLF